MDRKALGQFGEDVACDYLKKHGYAILDRNFHCRLGELDIVALHAQVLVGVEVKTRWSKAFGTPEEAVTPRKVAHMIKTLQYYAMLHPHLPQAQRLDVVAIEVDENGHPQNIRLITNISQ